MSKTRIKKIPHRNRNHSGWWIFCEVEYWVPSGRKVVPSSRLLTWENTRLVRAKSREEAYRKAMEFGRAGHPFKTGEGEWRFAGLSQLLPLYEKIEDGVEILWDVRGRLTSKRIKSLVRTKKELPVFNDQERMVA